MKKKPTNQRTRRANMRGSQWRDICTFYSSIIPTLRHMKNAIISRKKYFRAIRFVGFAEMWYECNTQKSHFQCYNIFSHRVQHSEQISSYNTQYADSYNFSIFPLTHGGTTRFIILLTQSYSLSYSAHTENALYLWSSQLLLSVPCGYVWLTEMLHGLPYLYTPKAVYWD